ncbi:MAG TPA: PIG-L family deacetylase [Azoarcus sp.]|nr:PIG-L family deacetylase [Azoarcus sp.]
MAKDVRPGPANISTLDLPRDSRLAVLAPHPDDFDAIAITMRHFQRLGWSIHVAVLTGGASGVEEGFAGVYTPAEKVALREREQRASLHAFGLPEEALCFLRLDGDDSRLPLNEGSVAAVRAFLDRTDPSLVFMPHGNDSNEAHRHTWNLFSEIARADERKVEAWLNRDAKTQAMNEDVATRFGASDAQWKASLLRLHASQHARNLNSRGTGFDERILAVNRAAAEAAGWPGEWAEVFERVGF